MVRSRRRRGCARARRAAGCRRPGTGPSPSWPPGWNARRRRRPWRGSARSRRSGRRRRHPGGRGRSRASAAKDSTSRLLIVPAWSVCVTERLRAPVSAACRLATTWSRPALAACGVVVALPMASWICWICRRPGRAPASTASTAVMKASAPWRRWPAAWRAATQAVRPAMPSTARRPSSLSETAAKASVMAPAARCERRCIGLRRRRGRGAGLAEEALLGVDRLGQGAGQCRVVGGLQCADPPPGVAGRGGGVGRGGGDRRARGGGVQPGEAVGERVVGAGEAGYGGLGLVGIRRVLVAPAADDERDHGRGGDDQQQRDCGQDARLARAGRSGRRRCRRRRARSDERRGGDARRLVPSRHLRWLPRRRPAAPAPSSAVRPAGRR